MGKRGQMRTEADIGPEKGQSGAGARARGGPPSADIPRLEDEGLPGFPSLGDGGLPPDRRLTDEERYPLLTAAGRRMLDRLRRHPHGPTFNHECGDRLDAAALERVRRFAEALRSADRRVEWGRPPEWVEAFARAACRRVPFYRARGPWPGSFAALPTATRADLAREPWSFVPDGEPLDQLIVYDTSGTTGHRIVLPSHPETAAKYIPLLEAALATRVVRLEGGPDRVSMIQVCAQKRTWTFGNIVSYLDGAGFAKVNLDPDDWRDPEDRVRYLDDCDPEVYTGDPLAFQELARLPLRTRPKALLSSATAMLPGVRRELECRFQCPVLDIYSMKESGPIAVDTPGGHALIPHDLYVEVLDLEGRPCPPGERGEIALTGGRNPYLPLLRYRTGDWASLDLRGPVPVLAGIEGRPPVVFTAADGRAINNVDVTWALRDLPLTRFRLHQHADGSLTFRGATHEAVREALQGLFGAGQEIRFEDIPEEEAWSGKIVQYTRE